MFKQRGDSIAGKTVAVSGSGNVATYAVEYIFGIPGEENLDMLASIRNSKIKLILTRHEQAAGFIRRTWGEA